MGILRKSNHLDDEALYLHRDHTIGRDPRCLTVLNGTKVSRSHARIYYQGNLWMLRDMGSRNGTYVNGKRVLPGRPVRLEATDRILFGDIEEDWTFCDNGRPCSMLIPADGDGNPTMLGDLVALPSEGTPRCTVFRSADDRTFVLEDENGQTTLLEHRHIVAIDGLRYCVHIDSASEDLIPETRTEDRAMAAGGLEEIHLSIRVAPDEESAAVLLTVDHVEHALPPRAHLYLLAYLARLRITQTPPQADAVAAPDAYGWLDCESACKDLLINREHLAQMVFRVRQDMKAVNSVIAKRIIDRQLRGRMRIGFPSSCLSVERLV